MTDDLGELDTLAEAPAPEMGVVESRAMRISETEDGEPVDEPLDADEQAQEVPDDGP